MVKYKIDYQDTIELIKKEVRGVYSESHLIIPALILLYENPAGIITTSKMIPKLEKMLLPRGHDAQVIPGRQDTYFSQKVRNLKSHNTLTNKGLAIYKKGTWKITQKGIFFLDENKFVLALMKAQGFKLKKIADEVEGDFSLIVIEEGQLEQRTSKQRRRSQKLTQIAITEFKKRYGKLFCTVCDFDFFKTYKKYGKDYIEIHHLKPVHLMNTKGIKTILSKALDKVVPVCSNCHRMIHRRRGQMLSIETLTEVVRQSKQ